MSTDAVQLVNCYKSPDRKQQSSCDQWLWLSVAHRVCPRLPTAGCMRMQNRLIPRTIMPRTESPRKNLVFGVKIRVIGFGGGLVVVPGVLIWGLLYGGFVRDSECIPLCRVVVWRDGLPLGALSARSCRRRFCQYAGRCRHRTVSRMRFRCVDSSIINCRLRSYKELLTRRIIVFRSSI